MTPAQASKGSGAINNRGGARYHKLLCEARGLPLWKPRRAWVEDLLKRPRLLQQQGGFASSEARQLQRSKQTPRDQVRGAAQLNHRRETRHRPRLDQEPAERYPHQVLGATHLHRAAERHHQQGPTAKLSEAAGQQATGSLTSAGSGIYFSGVIFEWTAEISTVLPLFIYLFLSVFLHQGFDTSFHRGGVLEQHVSCTCVVSCFDCCPYQAILLFGIPSERFS